jgi:hypothetical protein
VFRLERHVQSLESYINSTDPLPASNMVHSVIRNLIRNENINKKRYGLLANLSVITTVTCKTINTGGV